MKSDSRPRGLTWTQRENSISTEDHMPQLRHARVTASNSLATPNRRTTDTKLLRLEFWSTFLKWLSFAALKLWAGWQKNGKGFPYLLPSFGPGADPGVQAVSLQVTVSHPSSITLLPLLSARPAVTFPAAEHHWPLASTKLYCLVTEAHMCEQLAQGCYAALPRVGFELTTCWSQVQCSTLWWQKWLQKTSPTYPIKFSSRTGRGRKSKGDELIPNHVKMVIKMAL